MFSLSLLFRCKMCYVKIEINIWRKFAFLKWSLLDEWCNVKWSYLTLMLHSATIYFTCELTVEDFKKPTTRISKNSWFCKLRRRYSSKYIINISRYSFLIILRCTGPIMFLLKFGPLHWNNFYLQSARTASFIKFYTSLQKNEKFAFFIDLSLKFKRCVACTWQF